MPIINLQKRARELGRIRLGQKTASGAPTKLDRFRFTSASKALLEKVAELYGGEVVAWTPAGGSPQWEVVSNSNRVPIMVPPQPVTQWHEAWRKSGCVHRCDGERNVLIDEPCDPEDPLHLEALKKPTTRLNVVLRDVEGIGVWRCESHGWNAATEIPDVAQFLAAAGGYVNGWLSLEQRTSIDNSGDKPLTRHFMVPIIEIDVTPAQLMAGHGRVAAPALAGGPVGERPALAASGPDYVALAADLTDPAEITALWNQAKAAGHMTDGLNSHLHKRHAELAEATEPGSGGAPQGEAVDSTPAASPVPDEDGVVDAELVPDEGDADAVWARIVAAGADRGLGKLPDLQDDVATFLGIGADQASAEELQLYLDELLKREVAAA